jgi:hypothetical protein
MSRITVENILSQIEQLPAVERAQLLQTLEQEQQPPVSGASTRQEQQPSTKEPLDKRVPSLPAPDRSSELRWVLAHKREYANHWIAIEGERVIAHGANAQEVFAAADADGAYLPLVMYVEDPDKPPDFFGPALILRQG